MAVVRSAMENNRFCFIAISADSEDISLCPGCALHHDFFSSADSSYRKSAAQYFTKRGDIRFDIVYMLRTSEIDAESSFHFIKNEDDVEFFGQFFQPAHKYIVSRNEPALHRLKNDCCQFISMLAEKRLCRGQIIKREHDSVFTLFFRNAARFHDWRRRIAVSCIFLAWIDAD